MAKMRIDVLDVGGSPLLAESCVKLIVNAFGDPVRYSSERIGRELASDDPGFYRRFFVAMAAGEVLGIGGVKAADWASQTHLLYLSAVALEHRGQGIGRALVKARIDWLLGSFKHGRILVSTGKTKRFRDFGFSEVRNSALDGRHLLVRRF